MVVLGGSAVLVRVIVVVLVEKVPQVPSHLPLLGGTVTCLGAPIAFVSRLHQRTNVDIRVEGVSRSIEGISDCIALVGDSVALLGRPITALGWVLVLAWLNRQIGPVPTLLHHVIPSEDRASLVISHEKVSDPAGRDCNDKYINRPKCSPAVRGQETRSTGTGTPSVTRDPIRLDEDGVLAIRTVTLRGD